jgi:hypothetical protein
MTVQSRTTLKSYFITGASPSESDFADLIDSTLIVGDIIDNLTSTSAVLPLSAASGKILNDSISQLDARVISLEGAEVTFGSNYYNKTEIDTKLTAVDTVISELPYGTDIAGLQVQINSLNTSLQGKADQDHTQAISSVVNLQSTLDTKATINQLNDVRDSLIDSINAISAGSGGSVDLSGINASIASLTQEIADLESELDGKASINHVHDVYSKIEVDGLIAGIDTSDHQHVAADITDFNTEIQSKTNLLVQDHSALTNNPHAVTKAQVGLGKVENLTPEEIIAQAGGITQGGIDDLTNQINTHISDSTNPHGVTKEDVGLSNVPNINVNSLLAEHLQASNPHGIDLSFFDVYATAQADARTQFYIDSLRYSFTPTANNDSAGAVGDIAYDQNNLYFKTSNTQWSKIPFNPVYIQREATQEDVDAGLATSVGDTITVNEVELQEVTTINITENFNITNNAGDQVFNITEEGDVHLTSTSIENITIEGDTVINETISSTTEQITLQNNTTIQGDTIIAGNQTTINNNLTVEGETNLTNVTITNQNNENILFVNDSGDLVIPSVSIGNLNTSSIFSPTNNFTIESDTNITGTISSPTGSLEYIDTSEIEFWEADKFDGSQATDLQSSRLTLEFGSPDRLKLSNQGDIKVIAYLNDLPDLSGYALKSELPTTSNDGDVQDTTGGTETDIVIPGTTGGALEGYAYDPSGPYAIDYGADGLYGTADDIDEEYWSLSTSSNINTGLLIDFGNPATNPYIRYDVIVNGWVVFDGQDQFYLTDSYTKTESDSRYLQVGDSYTKSESDGRYLQVASELSYDIIGTDDPYIRYDSLAGKWLAFDGTSLSEVGASTTIVNEGDTVTNTTVLNQTIVQQNLTVDGTTGGEANGYAYSEYDDGTGTLVGEKYSIDYGADGVYGTADDDDTEDYFEIEESAYQNAGLTVDAGLDPNPSIKYDGNANRWIVDDGASHGTFYLGEAEGYVAYDQSQTLTSAQQSQARSNIGAQAAGSYLTSIPSEYLTQTEGDARYYTKQQVDQIAASFPSRQEVLEMIVAANEGTLLTPEYSMGSGGNYSIDYGADNTYGTADDGANTADQDYSYEPSLAA